MSLHLFARVAGSGGQPQFMRVRCSSIQIGTKKGEGWSNDNRERHRRRIHGLDSKADLCVTGVTILE